MALLTSGADLSAILSAISTVGFPIVCCGVMFYQNWRQDEKHESESKAFAEALNNNTLAIQKLTMLMEGRFEDDKR